MNKYFPQFEENKHFIFVLASLTYHGDFIGTTKADIEVLETLVYKKQDLKTFRDEANDLYQAFYNYSDEKFNSAIKLKPVRILLKYFIENSK